jgi:hypothetical protein
MPSFFLLLSFIVLVPIVPAYLLFKILPSTGNVNGTLKGMEIKLGGAFAGYFALVFLIISELPKIKEVVNPASAQVWDVVGQIVDENGHGVEPLSPADIKFEPGVLILHRNGLFRATFATQLSRTAQGMEFPSLYLSHEGFQEMTVDLGPPISKADMGPLENRDEKTHLIKLKPFVLKKFSAPYSPAGPAPQPVDPAAYAASTARPPQGGPNP